MCCRGAWAACVRVGGSPVAWRVAAAFAYAVALWMRSAGRVGSEDEVEDIDEDEDEEEVVVLGDAGCAVMRAVAGLWAAAFAAATAGRMEGMSSGCRLGLGGWGGLAVTWRPGGLIWSAAVGEGGAGLRSFPSGLGLAGVLQCVRLCGLASAARNSSRGLHSGAGGGVGLGFLQCARGAGAGHWAGWPCRGAWDSPWWVCSGCWVWGVVRGVRQVGLPRACAVAWADGGGPCRGAPGCVPWWACVGLRVGSGGAGAWAGIARGCVLCRCMCPLAAACLCGQLQAGRFGGGACRHLRPRLGFRRRACVFGAPLGQWWEEGMLALG